MRNILSNKHFSPDYKFTMINSFAVCLGKWQIALWVSSR